MSTQALREALEKLRAEAEEVRSSRLKIYQAERERNPEIAGAAKIFADRACGELDAYHKLEAALAASEPGEAVDKESLECEMGRVQEALECAEFALSHPESDQAFALDAVRDVLGAMNDYLPERVQPATAKQAGKGK